MAVVLLFGQALCDLNLPNYMSDIVNVGIQQSGIEHAAPNAISVDGLKLMTTFMTDSEKEIVNSSYKLVLATDKTSEGKEYKDIYADAGEQLYVLKEITASEYDTLDTVFGTATWTLINSMRTIAEQSGTSSASSSSFSADDIDITKLYEMQPMFQMIPANIITDAHDKAIANDVSLLKQSGIMLTKAFYTELGADVGNIQTMYIIKIGVFMLIIALLGGVATVLVSFISSKIAAGVAKNLRTDMFNKIESFSNSEFDKFSKASLITRCTNDIK